MEAELEVDTTEFVNSAVHDKALRTCPRYHSSRSNMKEPTKSLLFHNMKSLFLPEHIVEYTKLVAHYFTVK